MSVTFRHLRYLSMLVRYCMYVCMYVCMDIYTYYGKFVCMCVVNVD